MVDARVKKCLTSFFTQYYREEGRDFPWRSVKDPYITLVTEVMLRKTTAEKLHHCWDEFFVTFPTPSDLALAESDRIESIIRPLGLQRQRARDLLVMAQDLQTAHNGRIPRNYDDLVKLHGVGAYASSATLCFGFNVAIPIVDVNVARVYSRIFDTQFEKDIYHDPRLVTLASELLPRKRALAKQFNYGLLDFGAKVCRARNPKCSDCGLKDTCGSSQGGTNG